MWTVKTNKYFECLTQSTIAAYGMQRLLCAKDRQIGNLREECDKGKNVIKQSEGVAAAALRRESNLEKEVERLRMEAGEVPDERLLS